MVVTGVGNGVATTSFSLVVNTNRIDKNNFECISLETTVKSRSLDGLLARNEVIERKEIFISGFMHVRDDANCYLLAYAVFKALLLLSVVMMSVL